MKRVTPLVLLAIFLIAPSYAGAQLQLPGTGAALSMTLSPAYPSPGETVTLTLSSPVYDLSRASVTWNSGGKVLESGAGVTSATVVAGKLGEKTLVTADVSVEGTEDSAQILIMPTAVDLLWEADTYTPPFYGGRALPSAGSRVRLQAIPYLPKPGGGFYGANELSYIWKQNGSTLSSISSKGKSSAVIAAPDLFGNYTISVEALSPDGTTSGAARARIVSVEPDIRLYRDHPLFGVEYFDALGPNVFLDDSEMTFAAIPYFSAARNPRENRLVYAWRINGKSITADGKQPNEITISAGGEGGLARIELSFTDAKNFLTEANGAWAVTFTRGGGIRAGGAASDPFRGER